MSAHQNRFGVGRGAAGRGGPHATSVAIPGISRNYFQTIGMPQVSAGRGRPGLRGIGGQGAWTTSAPASPMRAHRRVHSDKCTQLYMQVLLKERVDGVFHCSQGDLVRMVSLLEKRLVSHATSLAAVHHRLGSRLLNAAIESRQCSPNCNTKDKYSLKLWARPTAKQ